MQPKFWNSPAFSMTSAIALLGFNFWWLGPWLAQNQGEVAGNAAYIAIRVLVFVGLPLLISTRPETPRFRAISALGAVAFTDQVLFKVLFFWLDKRANPEAWVDLDFRGFAMGTFTSFILFCPILLGLGALGAATGRKLIAKARPSA